jgi:hypothetical protein
MDTAAPKPNLDELRQLIEDFDRLHGGKETPEQLRAIGITPEGMGTSQCSQKIQQHMKALSAPDSRGVRAHLVSLRTQLIHANLILRFIRDGQHYDFRPCVNRAEMSYNCRKVFEEITCVMQAGRKHAALPF